MHQYYLARQAIFDGDIKVVGYELLYRAIGANSTRPPDGDQATSQVLLNSLIELGLARVVGDHRAFINLGRSFVLNHQLLPPPSDQIILELHEDTTTDEQTISAVKEMKKRGYVLALDDFVYDEKWRPLLELADIVKIDLRMLPRETIEQHIAILKQYHVLLLAEKVETMDEFDWCKQSGFDYFQGFFLDRPRIISGKRAPVNRLNCLRLMTRLHDPNCTVDELERVIGQDVTLSYKLLQYINSAAFPTTKAIGSRVRFQSETSPFRMSRK